MSCTCDLPRFTPYTKYTFFPKPRPWEKWTNSTTIRDGKAGNIWRRQRQVGTVSNSFDGTAAHPLCEREVYWSISSNHSKYVKRLIINAPTCESEIYGVHAYTYCTYTHVPADACVLKKISASSLVEIDIEPVKITDLKLCLPSEFAAHHTYTLINVKHIRGSVWKPMRADLKEELETAIWTAF
jgi:hypothetical protein